MEVERVQAIASLSILKDTLPPEFIRSEYEQPGITTFTGPVPDIPVIDLSKREALMQEIRNASEEWGIFQVVNHGIPEKVIKELQSVGKEFFELPLKEKEKYAVKPGSFEGYGTKLQKEPEGKKAWVDYLFHNVWPPSRVNHDIWPQNPPSYREANEEYAKHLIRVVDDLLEILSEGLGLEKQVLKESVGGDGLEYLLKINYYPKCPRPDLALGVVAHTDMSAITILVPNEVPGLQVFKDDHWFDAKYVPNALVVHIGDQIEVRFFMLLAL
ncbi:Flavonol synthase protein [Dioscorea alata]|uniref:Flavonol synthase protein n=1 Tax=Dioscorea alata TaxID=55571 RepID=A0ACB7U5Y6_DIOAL|nr:Flavonol synthase protein [Dioscorea alata]